MSKKNKSTATNAIKPSQPLEQAMKPGTTNQVPSTTNQEHYIPIIDLDLPAELIDHLVETDINTLGDLIQLSRDQEALEAILETDALYQVLNLIAIFEADAAQTALDDPVERNDPPAEHVPASESKAKVPAKPNQRKAGGKAESAVEPETSLQPPA